jgi:hypothetical protein
MYALPNTHKTLSGEDRAPCPCTLDSPVLACGAISAKPTESSPSANELTAELRGSPSADELTAVPRGSSSADELTALLRGSPSGAELGVLARALALRRRACWQVA